MSQPDSLFLTSGIPGMDRLLGGGMPVRRCLRVVEGLEVLGRAVWPRSRLRAAGELMPQGERG